MIGSSNNSWEWEERGRGLSVGLEAFWFYILAHLPNAVTVPIGCRVPRDCSVPEVRACAEGSLLAVYQWMARSRPGEPWFDNYISGCRYTWL